jgi:hypothetical protein
VGWSNNALVFVVPGLSLGYGTKYSEQEYFFESSQSNAKTAS